jgi:hypothetical protein
LKKQLEKKFLARLFLGAQETLRLAGQIRLLLSEPLDGKPHEALKKCLAIVGDGRIKIINRKERKE